MVFLMKNDEYKNCRMVYIIKYRSSYWSATPRLCSQCKLLFKTILKLFLEQTHPYSHALTFIFLSLLCCSALIPPISTCLQYSVVHLEQIVLRLYGYILSAYFGCLGMMIFGIEFQATAKIYLQSFCIQLVHT